MKFAKWHGAGNDFIIVNAFEEKIGDIHNVARTLCHRHFGIGADGLVLVGPPTRPDAHFEMRNYTADGEETEMCGNATRCVARFIRSSGLSDEKEIKLETPAGLIVPRMVGCGDRELVEVDMGEPHLRRKDMWINEGDQDSMALDIPLTVHDVTFFGSAVSMGNPHFVTFVYDVEALDLAKFGPALETHQIFSRKSNIEFVQKLSPSRIRMRVWERGSAITMACGTGSCASCVAGVLTKRLERKVTVVLDGGELTVEWGEDNHVRMTGEAVEVFTGTVNI